MLQRIRAVPRGFVSTYGDIDPHAPRMVGRVLSTTDARLPWHRIVRADGTVAKGERQLRLLRREGVPLRGERVDLARARFLVPRAPGAAGSAAAPGLTRT
ncbi:MAG TPA: MGMT family protein [Candidatus Dormibacteraeota bacterium]|nr:MGMT family protein [Candidatus Dormibacteraeota bacterium]